jgi:hypothetical protein
MKSRIRAIAKFSIILCGALMPMMVFGQGPLPPPPPEGIPLDLVSGFILAGVALYSGTKIYFKREAV